MYSGVQDRFFMDRLGDPSAGSVGDEKELVETVDHRV